MGWSPIGHRYNARLPFKHKGERLMPEIYVHAVKGRTPEQKKALIKDITDAVVKNFNTPADAVVVTIIEAEAASKAKGGVLFSEMKR
jgi:4-oxalocrotonate tautomerase